MGERIRVGRWALLSSTISALVAGAFVLGQTPAHGVTDTTPPQAVLSVSSNDLRIHTDLTLDGSASSDSDGDALTFQWQVDGGVPTTPNTEPTLVISDLSAGVHSITLTVTDPSGNSSSASTAVGVYRFYSCASKRIYKRGPWKIMRSSKAVGGRYCYAPDFSNLEAPVDLRFRFTGPRIDFLYGKSKYGGDGLLVIDHKDWGVYDFGHRESTDRPIFGFVDSHPEVGNWLGVSPWKHTKLRVTMAEAWIEGFKVYGKLRPPGH